MTERVHRHDDPNRLGEVPEEKPRTMEHRRAYGRVIAPCVNRGIHDLAHDTGQACPLCNRAPGNG